jgi:hypothetical protein
MIWDVVLGGVVGLLGNAVTTYFTYKQKLMEYTHAEKMIELEMKAMLAEAEANIKIVRAQVEGAVEIADSAAYMESIKQGNRDQFSDKWIADLLTVKGKWRFIAIPVAVLIAFLFGIVDFFKSFMRPALTAYLVGLTTWVTLLAKDILDRSGVDTLTAAQAIVLFDNVVTLIIFLTTSCVTWWFGDRRISKAIEKRFSRPTTTTTITK